jgi:hypothetical protein
MTEQNKSVCGVLYSSKVPIAVFMADDVNSLVEKTDKYLIGSKATVVVFAMVDGVSQGMPIAYIAKCKPSPASGLIQTVLYQPKEARRLPTAVKQ